MHSYSCPICNSQSYERKTVYKGNFFPFLNKTIVKCKECHILSAYPMPSDKDLDVYYTSYWQTHDLEKEIPVFKTQAETRYLFLKPYLSKSGILNMLDVGAGFGLISEIISADAAGNKTEYDVVELDPVAIDYLKRKIIPRAIYSHIKNIKSRYEVIMLSHILEHLTRPLSFLLDLRNRLTEGGVIFIEVPNQDYKFKSRNEPHLVFFSPDTLSGLVEKAGFKVLKVDTCGARVEDLIERRRKIKKFDKLKEIFKPYIPKYLKKKIRETMNTRTKPMKASFENISKYGPDRNWIRLIAQR